MIQYEPHHRLDGPLEFSAFGSVLLVVDLNNDGYELLLLSLLVLVSAISPCIHQMDVSWNVSKQYHDTCQVMTVDFHSDQPEKRCRINIGKLCALFCFPLVLNFLLQSVAVVCISLIVKLV